MKQAIVCGCAVVGLLWTATKVTVNLVASDLNGDFGAFVADQRAHAEELFGFTAPLEESALGPYDALDNLQAIPVAAGLHVSLVSSSIASAADQIAFWPDDDNPTHVFVCDEETSNPAVQRVDLSGDPASNATTIVTGFKRRAVGSLSFESFAIKPDGTMIYGDELAPSGRRNGGGIYKFVPAIPFAGGGPISVPAESPLAAGTIYGLHVGRTNNSSNWGQGAETGKGRWTAVDLTLTNVPQPRVQGQ